MIPGGAQTPINTSQNRTSNRFRTGRNENRQERRRNQANFNKFLIEKAVTNQLAVTACPIKPDYRQ